MTILELRQAIATLLSDLLGSYVLPSGTQKPAIYVAGEKSTPKGWKVTGLEVTIRQYPQQASRPLMGTVRIAKTWEVVLVNYTPGSPSLENAINRIIRHFPDARTNYLPYSDTSYEQYRILVPDIEIQTQYMRAE